MAVGSRAKLKLTQIQIHVTLKQGSLKQRSCCLNIISRSNLKLNMNIDQEKPFNFGSNEFQHETWNEVLVAVDKTYAELVDYQERLEAQNNELHSLRRFLSSVLASISDYIVVIDRDGEIIEAGTAVCNATGVEIDVLKSRGVFEVFEANGDTDLEVHLTYVVSARQTVTIDAQLRGTETNEPVELKIAPRLDRRKKVIGAVLTARPMGELRRAFSSLEESHEQLKQAQVQLVRNEKLASLGRLLAGVAHELNNPISFVYANTHAMEKYIDRFEQYFERVQNGASRQELISLREELKLDREMRNLRSAIDGSRDGAKRVRDIVEELRRLSADGTGEFERFDLVELARNALNWIERGAKQDFKVVFSGATSAFALARVGHIQQVLLNLIQNAADAVEGMADPRLSFQFEVTSDRAIFTIQDNGPGIDHTLADKIFDPFFTTKDVGRGTGLGLSISHKIVEEHGGDLRLLSAEKGGGCFQLSLPSKITP